MLKKGLCVFISFLTLQVAAYAASCPKATSTDKAEFCESFKKAAMCHCASSPIPAEKCSDMNKFYNFLISTFRSHSLHEVCSFQKHTNVQECEDDWNCYRKGGMDSKGRLCNGTGLPCL
jgi:hypothetical protein